MPIPASAGRPAYRLVQWVWAGLDWLYPPRCGGCERPGARWCADCRQAVRFVTSPICPKCGQSQPVDGLCPECRAAFPAYTALRSWAEYAGPVRAAIHRLKFKGDILLGEILARPMITQLAALNWPIDLATPVPIGIARQAERGYNQSSLLAWPVALGSGISYRPAALKKVRETRSQVGLSAQARRQNLSGAFQAQPKVVRGKNVLVVDDVTTTGATLLECTAALLQAGARAVYGLTLARAVFPPNRIAAPNPSSLERAGEPARPL